MSAEFNVGDVCQFKELDELKEEYGRNINVDAGWNPAMAEMCGKVFTIKEVIDSSRGFYKYTSEERIEYCRGDGLRWQISGDMLKPYDDIRKDINEDDFVNVLFG